MQLIASAVAVLCLLLNNVDAQKCPASPGIPNCFLEPDVGSVDGIDCEYRSGNGYSWINDTQTCETLKYLGCEGNANRFCTIRSCELRCHPRYALKITTRKKYHRKTPLSSKTINISKQKNTTVLPTTTPYGPSTSKTINISKLQNTTEVPTTTPLGQSTYGPHMVEDSLDE